MAGIPVPVPASVLVDGELARRRARFTPRTGNILTGCQEIDEYVLLGGFERGSVVGVSSEDDEVGLLIGLQTASHLLVTALLGNDGTGTNYPKVTIITMSPLNVLVPKLRQILVNQLATFPAGLQNINSNVKRGLEQISISMVFDIEGLQEVLGEIEGPEETTPAVQEPTPVQAVTAEEAVIPQPKPKPKPRPAVPQPARIKTEIRDSEDEDDDYEDQVQGSIVRSESSSPLSDPPDDLEDLYEEEEDTVPDMENKAVNRETDPERQTNSKQPPPLPPTEVYQRSETEGNDKKTESQTDNKPLPLPPTPKVGVNKPPDLILITHMTSLMNALFTGRDKPTFHETMASLSSQLRQVTRPTSSNHSFSSDDIVHVSRPPLVIILNSTTMFYPSRFDMADVNNNNKPEMARTTTTLKSIFQHDQPTGKAKPSFGMVFSQLLDLHLLCTRVPRKQQQQHRTKNTAAGDGPYGSVGISSHRFAWVVEVLLDEVGVYEFEHDETSEDKDGPETGLQEARMRVRRRCREQRWAAVEVDEGGGGLLI
ncbi:hypothetical protein V8F33_012843 [Rhypophila sp. PSN 637]